MHDLNMTLLILGSPLFPQFTEFYLPIFILMYFFGVKNRAINCLRTCIWNLLSGINNIMLLADLQ